MEKPFPLLPQFHQSHHVPIQKVPGHSDGSDHATPPHLRCTTAMEYTNDPPSTVLLSTAAHTIENSFNTGEAQHQSKADYVRRISPWPHMNVNRLPQGESITGVGRMPSRWTDKQSAASGALRYPLWPQTSSTVFHRSASQPPDLHAVKTMPGLIGANGPPSQQLASQTHSDAFNPSKWVKVHSAGPDPVALERHRTASTGAGMTAIEYWNGKVEAVGSNPAQMSHCSDTMDKFENVSTGVGGSASVSRVAQPVSLFSNQPFKLASSATSIPRQHVDSHVSSDLLGRTPGSHTHTVAEVTPNGSSEPTNAQAARKEDGEMIEGKAPPARKPRGRPRKNTIGP